MRSINVLKRVQSILAAWVKIWFILKNRNRLRSKVAKKKPDNLSNWLRRFQCVDSLDLRHYDRILKNFSFSKKKSQNNFFQAELYFIIVWIWIFFVKMDHFLKYQYVFKNVVKVRNKKVVIPKIQFYFQFWSSK